VVEVGMKQNRMFYLSSSTTLVGACDVMISYSPVLERGFSQGCVGIGQGAMAVN